MKKKKKEEKSDNHEEKASSNTHSLTILVSTIIHVCREYYRMLLLNVLTYGLLETS